MQSTEPPCTAVLKTEDGEVLAEGSVKLSVEDRYVEFHSQFVPLFPFGAKAQIALLSGGEETHLFRGSVYLSASTLLRLVDVDEGLLASANQALLRTMVQEAPQEVSLRVHVSPVVYEQGILRFAAERLLRFEAEVFSLSVHKMRFVTKETFDVEEHLLVSGEGAAAPLKKILVAVRQPLLFGDKNGYRCDIISMPDATREALISCLAQAAQEAEARHGE